MTLALVKLRHANPLWLAGFLCFVLQAVFVYLGVDFFSFPLFLLVFFLLAYVPGRVTVGLLNVAVSPLERFTLELGAGYVLTTLLYFICRYLKLELLYFLIIGILVLYYIYGLFKRELPWPAIKPEANVFSFSFIFVYFLVLLNSGYLNFASWLFTKEGSLRITMLHERDAVFHMSLVRELTNSLPPRFFFAGEYTFAYHYFPNLFASVFVRWAKLTPWDLLLKYLLVFNFTLFFLGVFILVRKLSDDRWVALFAVFLMNFMGNMGFLQKILVDNKSLPYWEETFVPLLIILNINPLLITTALICLGFFCLAHYLENSQRNWFCLSVIFLGVVVFFKVFAALQVLVGLSIPAVLLWLKRKDYRLISLGFVTGVFTLVGAFILTKNTPFSKSFLQFKPWFLVYYSLYFQHAAPHKFTYEQFLKLMFQKGTANFLYYFVWSGFIFLLGSLWLRVIGMKKWAEDLLGAAERPLPAVIAYTILIGLVFSFIFAVPPDGYNIIFYLALSLLLMSIYTALALFQLMEQISRNFKILFVVLFVTLSLPTTMNLILSKPKPISTDYIEPSFVHLNEYIGDNLPSGSLIALPPRFPYMLVTAFSSVRAMADMMFPIENWIGEETAYQLRKDNVLLYQDVGIKRLKEIIEYRHLDYIIEDQQFPIKTRKSKILKEIYREDGYIINQVISLK